MTQFGVSPQEKNAPSLFPGTSDLRKMPTLPQRLVIATKIFINPLTV